MSTGLLATPDQMIYNLMTSWQSIRHHRIFICLVKGNSWSGWSLSRPAMMKASPAKSRPTCWGERWNSSWRGTTTTGASCTKSVGTDSKTRYAAATIGGPKEASCTNKLGQQFFDWKSNHHQSQTSEKSTKKYTLEVTHLVEEATPV